MEEELRKRKKNQDDMCKMMAKVKRDPTLRKNAHAIVREIEMESGCAFSLMFKMGMLRRLEEGLPAFEPRTLLGRICLSRKDRLFHRLRRWFVKWRAVRRWLKLVKDRRITRGDVTVPGHLGAAAVESLTSRPTSN